MFALSVVVVMLGSLLLALIKDGILFIVYIIFYGETK